MPVNAAIFSVIIPLLILVISGLHDFLFAKYVIPAIWGHALLADVVVCCHSSALLGVQFVGDVVSMYLELPLQHCIFVHLIWHKVAAVTGLLADALHYQLVWVWVAPLLFM